MTTYGIAYPQPYLEPIFNAAHFPGKAGVSGGYPSLTLANVVAQNLTVSGNSTLENLSVAGNLDIGGATVNINGLNVTNTINAGTIFDGSLTALKMVATDSGKQLVSSTLSMAEANTIHSGLNGSDIQFATNGTLTTNTLSANALSLTNLTIPGTLSAGQIYDTSLTSAAIVYGSGTNGKLVSSTLTSTDADALHSGLAGGNISFASGNTLSCGTLSASAISAASVTSTGSISGSTLCDTGVSTGALLYASGTSGALTTSSLTSSDATSLHNALTAAGTTGNLSMCTSGTLTVGTLNATTLAAPNLTTTGSVSGSTLCDTGVSTGQLLYASGTTGALTTSSLTFSDASSLHNALTAAGTTGNLSMCTSGTLSVGTINATTLAAPNLTTTGSVSGSTLCDTGVSTGQLLYASGTTGALTTSALTQTDATSLHNALTAAGTTGNLSMCTSGTLTVNTISATNLSAPNLTTTGSISGSTLCDTGVSTGQLLYASGTTGALTTSALSSSDATTLHNSLSGTGLSFSTNGTLTTGTVSASSVTSTNYTVSGLSAVVVEANTSGKLVSSTLTSSDASSLHAALQGYNTSFATMGTLTTQNLNVTGGLDSIYASNAAGPCSLSLHTGMATNSAMQLGVAAAGGQFSLSANAGDIVMRQADGSKQFILQTGFGSGGLILDGSNNVNVKNTLNTQYEVVNGSSGTCLDILKVGGTYFKPTCLLVSAPLAGNARLGVCTSLLNDFLSNTQAGDSVLAADSRLVLGANGKGSFLIAQDGTVVLQVGSSQCLKIDTYNNANFYNQVSLNSGASVVHPYAVRWDACHFRKGTVTNNYYWIPLANRTGSGTPFCSIRVMGQTSHWTQDGISNSMFNFVFSTGLQRVKGVFYSIANAGPDSQEIDFHFISTGSGNWTLYLVMNVLQYSQDFWCQPNFTIESSPYFPSGTGDAGWNLITPPNQNPLYQYSTGGTETFPTYTIDISAWSGCSH